jgi:hypothetical protein
LRAALSIIEDQIALPDRTLQPPELDNVPSFVLVASSSTIAIAGALSGFTVLQKKAQGMNKIASPLF